MNIHNTIPGRRGLVAVRAQTSMSDLVQQVHAQVADFKAHYERRFDDVQATIDQMATGTAAQQISAGRGRVADPKYTAAWNDFLRTGEQEAEIRAANNTGRLAQIRASMSVGTPGDGGCLAPTEWDRKIYEGARTASAMRRISTVVQTGVNAYTTLWNLKGWGTGWVGETAARPETTSGTFSTLTFGHGEIYANAAATQRLLDDAELDLAQFIVDEVTEEFGVQENLAFVAGNGTSKPYGFLTYATGAANAAVHPAGAILIGVTAASATAVTGDELITLLYSLAAPYRQNAVWLMNSTTVATISKLKDSAGQYLWRPGLAIGQPQTLLGFPIEIEENMPSLVAGALPIAFGDFKRGYVINDRLGTRVLRDPYTAKPFTLFYCTKRVGGGVRDPNAIKLLKIATS